MLTPDYLFHVSDSIVELYEELNTFAVNDICRRLVKTDFRLSGSMEWQYRMLQEAGMSRREINKEIARITKKSEQEVKNIFEDSSIKSYNADMKVYRDAGLTPLPFAQSGAMLNILQSVYEQTNGTLHNLTRTTADVSQKLLIDTMSTVQFRILSGQQSYNQAIRQAVNKISNEGVKVSYRGTERNLESVVRTAVLTGVNQASLKEQIHAANQMGCDCLLTTAHMGARTGEGYKGHINWQGRVFSMTGKLYPEEEERIHENIGDLYRDTGYGRVDGLGGVNCRHGVRPWIIGHSSNPYTDDNGNPKIDTDENNKLYEIQQNQRLMERGIRNQKRKLLALKSSIDACAETDVKDMLQSDYNKASVKLRNQQAEYKKYCADNGVQTKSERMQIAKWSHKEAMQAYQSSKREQIAIANKAEYDTINREIKDLGVRGKISLNPEIIDTTDYQFDDNHMNVIRGHNVTRQEAESYIQSARVSIMRQDGKYVNYYSDNGATYVDVADKTIRTSFKREQFDEKLLGMLEVLNRHGK